MSYNKFPEEKFKVQRKNRKSCCVAKNMKSYSCMCSWGCPNCTYTYECKVCGLLYTDKFYEAEIKEQG